MTDFDPTDPWGQKSPWDEAQPQQTAPEVPVTNPPTSFATSPNPFSIKFSLKAAAGYEAEWLTPTVYGSTADETAQRGKDLLLAMKANGLIEFAAQAAQFTRGQYLGGGAKTAPPVAAQPSFQNGQVQFNQSGTPPFGGGAPEGDQGVTTCAHGPRKYFKKDDWEAMFCTAPKGSQCPPAFKDKKTGKYAVKG